MTTKATEATQATNATTEDRTITNTQHAAMLGALETLYAIVGGAFGIRSALPAWDECGEEQHGTIVSRTWTALQEKNTAMRSESVNAARAGVESVIGAHRAALCASRTTLTDLIAANPLVASSITLPETVKVPLFALLASFPTGTPESTAILALKDMGYKVSFGQGKGKELGPGYVSVSHEAPKPEETKAA